MWLENVLIFSVICLCYLPAHNCQFFRPECRTPNGDSGQCVPLNNCPTLINSYYSQDTQKLQFLRESICGSYEEYCCGQYDNYVSRATSATSRPTRTSNRPEYVWGSSNNNDNINNNRPTSSRRPSTGNSNNGSSGNRGGSGSNGGSGNRGGSGNNGGSGNRGGQGNQGGSSGLPDRSRCGRQTSDRILNGEETALDEFPWMALLQYRTRNGALTFNCGGTLISRRYVLTAAHCIRGEIERRIGPLVNVRLGEHDTSSERDCLSGDFVVEQCSLPVQDIPVDEAIAHEGYDDRSQNRYNDIAIVRLTRDAQLNNFVQPICLPTRSDVSRVGERLYVAGWGRTEYGRNSPVKLKLRVPIAQHDQCSLKFKLARVILSDNQICAGGERDKDSCSGDSGGPLMNTLGSDGSQWYQEGVVSFGAKCGTEGWPGIYTKVSGYLDWINRNVR